MEGVIVVKIDKALKRKAMYVLNIKGKTMSQEVRKMLEMYANEFNKLKEE